MREVFCRSAFNYDADLVSNETGLHFDPEVLPSMAQQQFADEVDINTIVKRFGLTGQLPDNVRVPMSGDFTGVVDFQTAMNAVRSAQESFMELPGHVRARFNNDPQRLMEFVADGKNVEEARKLGLLAEKPEVTRDVVTAVDDLAKVLTTPKPV